MRQQAPVHESITRLILTTLVMVAFVWTMFGLGQCSAFAYSCFWETVITPQGSIVCQTCCDRYGCVRNCA